MREVKIRPGSYNIRIESDENGNLSLGYAHKCYVVDSHMSEWKGVPDSVRTQLCKRLNVKEGK